MIEKMIEELMKWCKSVKKSNEQPVEVQNEEITTCKSEDKPKKSVPYTATDIFNYLQKRYPATMRGVAPIRLGRMLAHSRQAKENIVKSLRSLPLLKGDLRGMFSFVRLLFVVGCIIIP